MNSSRPLQVTAARGVVGAVVIIIIIIIIIYLFGSKDTV